MDDTVSADLDAGADVNSRVRPTTLVSTATTTELIEWLFFAYRDFTGEADAILAERGFGRAHHRVLHFVRRNPGIRVAALLDILKITKQSLARVLKQLVDNGCIEQRPGCHDRRERRLHLTASGAELADVLLRLQAEKLRRALDAAGPDSHNRVRDFLRGVVDERHRSDVAKLIATGSSSRK